MKKAKFSLVVSAVAFLFLLVGMNTASAQTLTPGAPAFNDNNVDLSGVNWMPMTEALQELEAIIKDDTNTPTTAQEEAYNSIWTEYLTHLYDEISATASVSETVGASKGELQSIMARFKTTLDPMELFDDAVELLSN